MRRHFYTRVVINTKIMLQLHVMYVCKSLDAKNAYIANKVVLLWMHVKKNADKMKYWQRVNFGNF